MPSNNATVGFTQCSTISVHDDILMFWQHVCNTQASDFNDDLKFSELFVSLAIKRHYNLVLSLRTGGADIYKSATRDRLQYG